MKREASIDRFGANGEGADVIGVLVTNIAPTQDDRIDAC